MKRIKWYWIVIIVLGFFAFRPIMELISNTAKFASGQVEASK